MLLGYAQVVFLAYFGSQGISMRIVQWLDGYLDLYVQCDLGQGLEFYIVSETAVFWLIVCSNLLIRMLLFQLLNRKSMFAILHSDMKYLKSGLPHLTGQPYCIKSWSAKVKVGIINLILRNYLVDLYNGARSVIIWVRQTWDLANLVLSKSFIVQAAWFWLIWKKNFFFCFEVSKLKYSNVFQAFLLFVCGATSFSIMTHNIVALTIKTLSKRHTA